MNLPHDDTWEYRGISLGDMNQDGKLDALDIGPFAAALLVSTTDSTNLYIADFNLSGTVDLPDLDPFVSALLGQ